MNHLEYGSLHVVFSGHTIFESEVLVVGLPPAGADQCHEDEDEEGCAVASCFFLSSARFRRCIVDNASLNPGS